MARWLSGALVLAACSSTSYRAQFTPKRDVAHIDRGADFLKCHLRDGGVYVLSHWSFSTDEKTVSGEGLHYDANRKVVDGGAETVDVADVELFETNRPESVPHNGLIVLAVVTGVSLGVTALCLANPKACFGSCPTFYVDDGHGKTLQAEGFSSSVLRSLEATDIDALWTAHATTRLDVLMTNDALETHAVDSVRLLTVPRPPGGRVLRAGETFYAASAMHPPVRCASASGDCSSAVTKTDALSYASPADAHDLATKETVDLTFEGVPGRAGVVIVAQNTLLNTFLFYQALAYMGRTAGDRYMRLDHAPPEERPDIASIGGLLGDIEVSVRGEDGALHRVGAYSEVGPLAREAVVVPIPEGLLRPRGEAVEVRLTMTAGNWKVDQTALAELGEQVTPRVLEPVSVHRDGAAPDAAALALLKPLGGHLITYPGDAYLLRFALPEGDQELFLESRGYYYEWIREAWLPEQSPVDLALLFLDPRGAMRRLAPAYKQIEADMEHTFWQSRFRPR